MPPGRPFAYEAVTLADELELDPEDTPGLEEFLASKVEALIVKAKAKGKEQVGDDGKDMVVSGWEERVGGDGEGMGMSGWEERVGDDGKEVVVSAEKNS